MSRVILLAGQGGAGTSTLVAATAAAARAEGASVRTVAASGPEAFAPPELAALISATIGSMALRAGADRLVPQAWSSLPEMRLMTVLDDVRRSSLDHDVVVVDVGSLTTLRDLLNLTPILLRLLDASLTPRAAIGGGGADDLFDALSEARLQLLHLSAMVMSAKTSVRLVGRPDIDAVDELVHSATIAAVLGVEVDGVILNRFPRRKDGAPGRVRRRARQAESELVAAMPGIPVWRSSGRVRPKPKGASVVDTLAGGHALRPVDDPRAVGAGFEWELSLPRAALDHVRVGVQGESLVVDYRGTYRWVELPSVLSRCIPVEGRRTDAGLTVSWLPDESVWPSAAGQMLGGDGDG